MKENGVFRETWVVENRCLSCDSPVAHPTRDPRDLSSIVSSCPRCGPLDEDGWYVTTPSRRRAARIAAVLDDGTGPDTDERK